MLWRGTVQHTARRSPQKTKVKCSLFTECASSSKFSPGSALCLNITWCRRRLVCQECQVWLQSGSDWTARTFSAPILVDFGSASQNELKFDLKESRICPIWGQSDPLLAQIWPTCNEVVVGSSRILLKVNCYYQCFSRQTPWYSIETKSMCKCVSAFTKSVYCHLYAF